MERSIRKLKISIMLVLGFVCAPLVYADNTPVYELRTYTTNEGKLDALEARFRDHTMAIFERLGMKNIAYWTSVAPALKANTLIYIISHESRDQARRNWKSFNSDPVWQRVMKASEEDGVLVKKIDSVFLAATDYSPLK